MRHLILFLATVASLLAQTTTPLSNARLLTQLDANGQDIVKADEIKFGTTNDAVIGRSGNSTLTLTGNLVVSGTVDFANNTVAWADVSKTGSSLADLATRSAGDLSTGTLANARLDSDLSALAELSGTGILRRTGAGTATAGTTVGIAEGGTGATTAGAARTSLGLGTTDTPQFAALQVFGEAQLLTAMIGLNATKLYGSANSSVEVTLPPATGTLATREYVTATAQPLDSDLTALAGVSTNGLWTRTGDGTGVPRAITGGTGVTVTNGDGVSGNPTVAIGQSVATTANVTFNLLTTTSGQINTSGSTGFVLDSTQSGWGAVAINTPNGASTATVGFGPGLSANRTYTFPDASGTVALASTTLSGYGITDAQPLDSDLTALAGASSNGLWARTGAGTGAARTITGTANQITVTNGDGVSGNPTLSLSANTALSGTVTVTGDPGILRITSTGSTPPVLQLLGEAQFLNAMVGYNATKLYGSANSSVDVTLPPATGTLATQEYVTATAQPLDSDLTALSNNTTAGIWTITGSGQGASRSVTGPAAGITVTNGNGASGNITLGLADDLAAVEGLGTSGIAVRTGNQTWSTRTIAGSANQISVTNGDGVSGNITLSIPNNPSFNGTLTITGNLTTAANGISWASVSKGNSSLADLATRSAGDLNSGTLDNARLDSDLAALGNNTINGLWARTGSGTGAARTIASGTGINVTNGDGVSGNPSIAVDSSVVTTAGNYTILGDNLFTGNNTFTSLVKIGNNAGNYTAVRVGNTTGAIPNYGGSNAVGVFVSMGDATPGATIHSEGSIGIVASSNGSIPAKFVQTGTGAHSSSPVIRAVRVNADSNVTSPMVQVNDSLLPKGQGGDLLVLQKLGVTVMSVDSNGRPVLFSPNGSRWALQVSDSGVLSTTLLP